MGSPIHPIYNLIRFGIVVAFLAFALWMFANQFDETEAKTIGTFIAMLVAALGAERVLGLKDMLKGKDK